MSLSFFSSMNTYIKSKKAAPAVSLASTTVPVLHFKGNVGDVNGTTITGYGSIAGDGNAAYNSNFLGQSSNGGVTIDTTSYKVGNGCFNLNSTEGGYFQMPNLILSNVGFTFCCWVKTTSLTPQGGYSRILDISDITAGPDYVNRFIIMCPSSTKLHLVTNVPNGQFNFTPELNVLVQDSWTHIAWTITTGNLSKFYVNGSLYGTYTNMIYPTATNYQWSIIGQQKGYSNPSFRGFLDDIRIYDGVLNPSEISAIYNLT